MKIINTKIAICLICLTGLIMEAQNGVVYLDSIMSGGIKRKFRVYVPNSYNGSTAVPLVFNLHGYTSNAMQQEAYSNFMPIADTAKFIVVCPDGTGASNNQFWNAGFGSGPNDVQFISELIDSVKSSYNIDLNSVYSCGMSNGGIMSYYLACNLPNRIAAIASVTGSMLNLWFSCTPSRPFPVMEIHGTGDATVPYNGDATFAPIDNVITKWSTFNNCNLTPITYSVPNINTSDNSTAVNYKYIGGTSGSNVELYKVTGGSHSWPGAFPIFSNTNQDFSASVAIWLFFRKYKLNQFIPNVGINELKNVDNSLTLFPNPANGILNIVSSTSTINSIEIKNNLGELIYQQLIVNRQPSINVSEFKSGIYFITVKTDEGTSCKKFVKE